MARQSSLPTLLMICGFAVLAVPTCCQTGGLMVTTPRVWVAGGQENVCIVSHALTPEVLCKIELHSAYEAKKNVTIPSGGSICIKVPVPSSISGSTTRLYVTAASLNTSNEYSFTKFADVRIQRPTQMTFIETDKPIYKPGDIVRIRILTLTGTDLTLLTDDILLAYIEDPSKTRVMQWTNVSTVNGLGSLEMRLSDEPRLGEWTIKALIKDEVPSQKFIVKEYVLPKFEVAIHHPSTLSTESSIVKWKVCARYTYGQPVNGNVSSNICFVRHSAHTTCQSVNSTKLKDGCVELSVNSSAIEEINRSRRSNTKANFFAEVEERGTGVKLNSTFTAVVHRISFQLKLIPEDPDSHHYKPGLPYYGQGQLTRTDGKPVTDKVVQLLAQAKRNEVINGTTRSDLTTDENGNFKYVLPGTFTRHRNSIDVSVEVKVHDVPRVSRTLKAWYSPSNSFLQIEPFEGIASCRSSLSLPSVFVTRNSSNTPLTFYFQLVTNGDIVHAGKLIINGSSLRKFNITFTVTPRMSGSMKVLAFTVLASGETVADSMLINVEQCFHNQVSMGFADQQKQPGHPTTLRLSADPHSLCSISVVDKSVKLMDKGDSSLSKSKVFEMLEQFDIPKAHHSQPSNVHEGDCGKITLTSTLDRHKRSMWRSRGYPGRPGRIQSKFVDSKKAFEDAGMIVLSDLTVVTRPCSRQRPYYHPYPYRHRYRSHEYEEILQSAGIRRSEIESRPRYAYAANIPRPLSPVPQRPETEPRQSPMHTAKVKPVLHRTFFPESWLWQLTSVGDSGTDDISLNLPHTITEWVGNGFCTNAQSGLGVSSPFSINAFQPFFVSFTLPYSMIRGEKVGIPVSVFNYMNQCLKVTLQVNRSTAFELNNDSPIKELRICGHQTETHTYRIVPRELGNINFTVKASSVAADDLETNSIEERLIMTAEDIVTRKLLVEAEGKEEEQTKSAYICAPAEGSFSIGLPNGLVEGSMRSFTSVIGDVMGPTLTGLESLLALPTGCGEQNMLKFSPNIFIMQYLQKTNSLTDDIRTKAIEFLRTGYQRELTYRHRDGSYSAFGQSDGDGSIWLTAFVVKSFAEARPFIYIDQKDLQKSIKWITSIQLENGCFPQVGRVLHKEMKGGMAGNDNNFAALTAYVLIALLEAGLTSQDPVILRGVQCLERQQVPVWDTYTQSLMAYAYTMWNRNETKRTEIMDALAARAIEADGMKHWTTANDSSASPAATEMTSYVLLAMLHNAKEEVIGDATPIVRWLSTQRNGRGGFSSTQDTVLALQALAEFAALTHRDDLNVRVMLTGTVWNHNVSVTYDNHLLLQKQEGQNLPSTLKYAVSGTGCVLLQASVKYNVMNYQGDQANAFLLNVSEHKTSSNNCKERSLKICTSYNGVDNASNMAVIAVKMVSGWIPDKDSIKKLSSDVSLGLKRFEIEKSMVQLYFEALDKTRRCFSFLVHQDIVVTDTKPVFVHVYDYYKPSLSAYDDYFITTCGTREDIAERNGPKKSTQKKLPKKPVQTDCPTCESNSTTELTRKICSASHAYGVVVVNQTSLNVVNSKTGVVNKTVSYRLPHKCAAKCAVLKTGAQVVLTMPVPISTSKKHAPLKLDATVAVMEISNIELIFGVQNTTKCP